MNNRILTALVTVIPAMLFVSPAVSHAQSPTVAVAPEKVSARQLQIVVNLPATAREASIAGDVEQNVAEYAMETIRQGGFVGKLDYVGPGYEPNESEPVLTLNVVEWKKDVAGNVDCTVAATLSTAKGEKDLGLLSGVSMIEGQSSSWLSRTNAFENAILGAFDDLYLRIQETNLLSI